MAKETLYFYDLETSGINAREARIMQFAGQRTDLDLKPIGEPDKVYVELTNDILPEPQAVLVTGITPQMTKTDGMSERDFAKFFIDKVATQNTTIVGYNTIRFDNEFIRYLMYRTFNDPYEWSYENSNTTWDILDLVRIARALRPDGIEWPFSSDGKPSNRLELLTKINHISHEDAHDALSDVYATIAVASLIKTKQPKLYDYIFKIKDKKLVIDTVNSGEPFVYTSGRYSADYQKTTVVVKICDHPAYGSSRALVYDLRVDPIQFMELNPSELAERFAYVKDKDANTPPRLPVKELTFNKCPAIAPLQVLDKATCQRIKLNLDEINSNLKKLLSDKTFAERVYHAYEDTKKAFNQQSMVSDLTTVDGQLYDGFFNDSDKRLMATVRARSDSELVDYNPNFADDRLKNLLLLYKARYTKASMSIDEQDIWEQYRKTKLLTGGDSSLIAKYFKTLEELSKTAPQHKDLLQDLWYWGESIVPAD